MTLQNLSRRLKKLSQRLGWTALVPVFGFVAGAIGHAVVIGMTGELLDTREKLIWGIVAFLAIAVGALMVLLVNKQTKILNQVESLNRKFVLKAEFIREREVDEEGRTYRRVQEYIENAKKSLIFVDQWVDKGPYSDRKERKDYYKALEERVDEFIHSPSRGNGPHHGVFYKRIVQMEDETPGQLSEDKVFSEHLRRMCARRRGHHDVIQVLSAKLFIHTHFAIIDDEIIVQPLLTFDEDGLKRHGAFIFFDQEHQLVSRYKEIVDNLDSKRFEESLLG